MAPLCKLNRPGEDTGAIRALGMEGASKRRGVTMLATILRLSLPLIAVLISSVASAEKRYDPGASDKIIKIGQVMPYSGPASSYSSTAKVEAAYFRMINERGGVNGRQLELISYDDAYSPPKTVEQVRKLIESDEVLLTFQIFGTAPNAAVQKYLNLKKVPQLLSVTGASRFSDPSNFPWTMAFNPNYKSEGRAYGKFILENYPEAKIAILFQNDDLGKDYVKGLMDGLGEKKSMVIAQAPYEVNEPTIDSQIVKLKSSGADVLFDMTTARFAAQAIKKLAEISWKPVHIISMNSASMEDVLMPAGLEASRGLISAAYLKDPSDPQWQADDTMKEYLAFMDKYYPEGKKYSAFGPFAYSSAQLLVKILEQCKDNLTRENVMLQAANLKNVTLDLLLPGIVINTNAQDYRVNRSFQIMRFNGDRWERRGPLLTEE